MLGKVILLAVCFLYTTGFALISSNKATLDATPDNPIVTFHWDGSYPSIKNKDLFEGTQLTGTNDHDVMKEILLFSFNKWNEIPGAFVQLTLIEDSEVNIDSEDDRHTIQAKTNQSLSSVASASPQTDDDGIIHDCDIRLSRSSVKAKDLAFTLIHELGHCLGLGHNHSNYDAIMGYSRTSKNLKLGEDDIAGAIYLYPDPEYASKPKELAQCGALAAIHSNQPSKSNIWLLLSLPLIFALVGNRRRFLTGARGQT